MKYLLRFTLSLAATFLSNFTAQAVMPVGYWDFNNEQLTDRSGNGNDGQSPTGVKFSTDVPPAIPGGNSVQFDGSQYLFVPHSPSLEFPGPLTVSLWVKGDPAAQTDTFPSLLAKYITSDKPGWRVDGQPDKGFHWNTCRFAEAFDGQWHHIAFVFDGAGVATYLDGKVVFSTNPIPYTEPILNKADLVIGARQKVGQMRPFVGQLDEIALFSEALDADQIQQLAHGTSPLQLP